MAPLSLREADVSPERMKPPLGRLDVQRLDGSEGFRLCRELLPFKVRDFWAWSVSDLVSNATRGRLAEYIVAKACRIDTAKPRDEWAAVDLVTPAGISIEVKSAAFIQSWHQDAYSKISFNVRKTLKWDPETGKASSPPCRVADVYVFALLAHKDQATLEPLNLGQWEFYVLPTSTLDARKRSQHSITLPSLRKLDSGPYGFSTVADAVCRAAADCLDRREEV